MKMHSSSDITFPWGWGLAARALWAGLALLLTAGPCAVASAGTHSDGSGDLVTMYGAQVKAPAMRESALSIRISRPDTMDELVWRLMQVVGDLGPYSAQVAKPAVKTLPLSELHAKLCGGSCTVRAAYVPGEGLLIDEAMRPDLNDYHKSILFHELVHHVQEMNGAHAALDECNRWRLREIEAYALQNRFLSALGARTQVMDPGIPCAEPPARGTQTFGESATPPRSE